MMMCRSFFGSTSLSSQPTLLKDAGPMITLRRRAPPRLIFEIDIGKLLTVGVAHDKAGVVEFFDGPRRREAAGWQPHSDHLVGR